MHTGSQGLDSWVCRALTSGVQTSPTLSRWPGAPGSQLPWVVRWCFNANPTFPTAQFLLHLGWLIDLFEDMILANFWDGLSYILKELFCFQLKYKGIHSRHIALLASVELSHDCGNPGLTAGTICFSRCTHGTVWGNQAFTLTGFFIFNHIYTHTPEKEKTQWETILSLSWNKVTRSPKLGEGLEGFNFSNGDGGPAPLVSSEQE